MRKVIPFLLIVCISLGSILVSHFFLRSLENDLTFSETVIAGDSSVLHDKELSFEIIAGDRLKWDCVYPFGTPEQAKTHFTFRHRDFDPEITFTNQACSFTLDQNYGLAGTVEFPDSGYGIIMQSLADKTAAGKTCEETVIISDYLDQLPVCYNIEYVSEEMLIMEYLSSGDVFRFLGDSELPPSYEGIQSFFSPQVPSGLEATFRVTKANDGSIYEIGISGINFPTLKYQYVMNDHGLFLNIPQQEDLILELPAGYGVYFIPWQQEFGMVYPDFTNAQLLISAADGNIIDQMIAHPELPLCYVLSQHQGAYFLSVLDVKTRTITKEIPLFSFADPTQKPYCSLQDGLLIITVGDQFAVLQVAENTELLFTYKDKQASSYLRDFTVGVGRMQLDGEQLIVIDSMQHYDNKAFWILVCSGDGVSYIGEYSCSVFAGNSPGYDSYIQIWENSYSLS